jgi:long-chain acyl-CoA synthetase
MAAYKYPRHVEIVKTLPLGPTGKILKTELRKMAAEKVAIAK